MNIIAYVKSLLSGFTKNRVVDDARVTYAELEGNTIPSYAQAEQLFYNWKYRSQQMKDFSATFKRIVKEDSQQNIIVGISRALDRVLENKIYVQEKIDQHFEEEIVTEGITCVKANLLRVLETVSFVSNYALSFLNYIYILETAQLNEENGYVRSNLSPAEIQHLQDRFTDFCMALNSIARKKDKFAKAIEDIPDVFLDINTGATLIGTIGEEKLDPLLMRNFSGNTMNLIYHVRMMVAERQIASYKKNKELKKVLELRLLNLRMQLENTPDAKIEKEISYTQGRVQSLEHDLKKLEEL